MRAKCRLLRQFARFARAALTLAAQAHPTVHSCGYIRGRKGMAPVAASAGRLAVELTHHPRVWECSGPAGVAVETDDQAFEQA